METRYPHALKLGIFLVAEHFGPTCRQVCSLLLERGRLSYDEIVAALVKIMTTVRVALQRVSGEVMVIKIQLARQDSCHGKCSTILPLRPGREVQI